MDTRKEFQFVGWQQPGQGHGLEGIKVVRQHARRAALKHRIYSLSEGKTKRFNGVEFVDEVRATSVSSSLQTEMDCGMEASKVTIRFQKASWTTASNSTRPPSNYPFRHGSMTTYLPPSQPDIRHPYTFWASSCVNLTVERIDHLFKDVAFRNAAEPLFHTGHVDSVLRMDAVYPGCLTSPAFFNALLYSVAHTANMGKSTPESLQLKGKALKNLNMTLSSTNPCMNHADIGAVMILQGVAYRWNDPVSYEAHTRGLSHLLQNSSSRSSCLTHAAERALFWQDLFASLLTNYVRHQPHQVHPQPLWQRTRRKDSRQSLPKGIAEHHDVLSNGLLDCIQDIVEMQAIVLSGNEEPVDLFLFETMQASIESRLSGSACGTSGTVARCCQLAAFITCFLTFTEKWNNALIPCKVCDILWKVLDRSLKDSVWLRRRNLQLWLLLVGSCTATMDKGYVESIRPMWGDLLNRFRTYSRGLPKSEVNRETITSSLQDFVYCKNWLSIRLEIREWSEMELALSAPEE